MFNMYSYTQYGVFNTLISSVVSRTVISIRLLRIYTLGVLPTAVQFVIGSLGTRVFEMQTATGREDVVC